MVKVAPCASLPALHLDCCSVHFLPSCNLAYYCLFDVLQGQLSGDELSAAYASGDVFMMPSESETLGFVALEAMASGLPVVAVAAGGLTDILTNPGVTGLIF